VLLGREPARQAVRFRTRQAGVLEVRRLGDGYELALPAIPTEPGSWPEAVAALGAEPLEVWRSPDRYNLFVYRDEDAVRDLRPDVRALAALGDDSFTVTAPGYATDIVSRVFVPGAGVDEDSVTGSAHAVLTPFWAERLGRSSFSAYQASARGGRLTCRLDGDRAWLGGSCVTVVEGCFRL
jgi:predicted PhzF superfamily epimerase YddE/YHI9